MRRRTLLCWSLSSAIGTCSAQRSLSSSTAKLVSATSPPPSRIFSAFTRPAPTRIHARAFTFSKVARDEQKPPANAKTVPLIFVNKDGSTKEVDAVVGENILTVAHANQIDLEGACEASLACSTCHVILEPEWYAKLPMPIEEEEDMLDLAFGLTSTSRLGCQIIVREDMAGMTLKLPAATRNMMVDGFKPKPH